MKYGKVLTYKDSEETKKLIGKEVVVSDYLAYIEDHPEKKETAILKDVIPTAPYPFATSNGRYQFIREIIEVPAELMTNRQLAEWCAKGNGEYVYEGVEPVYTNFAYYTPDENNPVTDDIRIRSWDSEEWVIPTVDIYERDCKGGSK